MGQPSYPTVSGAPAPPPAPTPPTPPAPPPAPTPAGTTHYGAPPCMDDEMAGDFEGGGKICSASCSTDADCPTDVPEGATNPQVQCALQDEDTGATYCGMMCGLFGGDCSTGQTCSKQFSVVKKEYKATDIDCSTAVCESQCTCSLDKCAAQIDACLAVDNCASAQTCALACPCSDNACMLKCAAASPSTKALPVASCVNNNCGSASVAV